MNNQTQSELMQQLSNRKLECEHINAVNQELHDELTQYKTAASGLVKICKAFGIDAEYALDVDVDELIALLQRIQQSGRDSSDRAGQLDAILKSLALQFEALKRDMHSANPGYNFEKLRYLASDFDMSQFGQAWVRLHHQSSKPEEWSVIGRHIAKVVNNCFDDKSIVAELKTGLAALGATGCTDATLTALELSARDLINRGEV